jgi:hypothetical protein
MGDVEFRNQIEEVIRQHGYDRFLIFVGAGIKSAYYLLGNQAQMMGDIVVATLSDDDIKGILCNAVLELRLDCEDQSFKIAHPDYVMDEKEG